MSRDTLPVRPDLEALRQEAAALGHADIGVAQLAIAEKYGAPGWQRLEQSCLLVDAIWGDDLAAVQSLVAQHPHLIHENAVIGNGNWGPPLSYAANLGRDQIIRFLYERGAADHEHGLGRALLQGRLDTARLLHKLMGSPTPGAELLSDPAYSLRADATALAFELGVRLPIVDGRRVAPVDVVLETDARKPAAKHEILAMYAEQGYQFPDTPMMALHLGRIDLLEGHLQRDPQLLHRTFRYDEICPPEVGCHEEWLPRTSLAGTTLLHVCVEYDELEIATWLLNQGMAVDARADVDAEGFGGQTALFHAVVCFANFWDNLHGVESEAAFARLLLRHGANPGARASLRERIFVDQKPTGFREHRDLTPTAWGEVYHNPMMVNRAAMALIGATSAS